MGLIFKYFKKFLKKLKITIKFLLCLKKIHLINNKSGEKQQV